MGRLHLQDSQLAQKKPAILQGFFCFITQNISLEKFRTVVSYACQFLLHLLYLCTFALHLLFGLHGINAVVGLFCWFGYTYCLHHIHTSVTLNWCR